LSLLSLADHGSTASLVESSANDVTSQVQRSGVEPPRVWRAVWTATPREPGVSQVLTVLTRGAHGVDPTTALAHSSMLLAVALVPTPILGALLPGMAVNRGVLEPDIWTTWRDRV